MTAVAGDFCEQEIAQGAVMIPGIITKRRIEQLLITMMIRVRSVVHKCMQLQSVKAAQPICREIQ
jgi:hypothetical protein